MNKTTNMNVLCVAAHPDDEVIGPGGTLAKHAADDDVVHVCILSDGVTSRYDEVTPEAEKEIARRRSQAEEATEVLGVDSVSFHTFPDNQFDSVPLLDIVKEVEAEIAEHEPKVIYTHHYGDLNVDHELTCRAVLTAARPLEGSPVRRILAFETLSSTEWGTPISDNSFQPTVFVGIESQIDKKIEALEKYGEELEPHPHPRNPENIRNVSRVWGARSGLRYAESFVLIREIQG